MMPCAWCVLQRLIFLAVAGAALLGLLLPGLRAQRSAAVLALVLALSGVAAALWQHFVASASTSCAQSLADRAMGFTGLDSAFPEVFAAYASCAEAKATLLGLPYEFFSLSLFVLLALAAWRVALAAWRVALRPA
jgi:disulfide bond formation protein DsbB